MKKDELIAKAISLGIGDDIDLVSLTKDELNQLISEKEKEEAVLRKDEPHKELPKHDYYRG